MRYFNDAMEWDRVFRLYRLTTTRRVIFDVFTRIELMEWMCFASKPLFLIKSYVDPGQENI